MTARSLLGSILFVAVLGCGSDAGAPSDTPAGDPPLGGQTGEETLGCVPVETEALAWSQRSPLGFSADELLNALGTEREAQLTWENGTRTRLQLELVRGAGELRFEQREWVDDDTGIEVAAAPLCNDVVSLPMTLHLTTSDGAFAEQWPVRLLAESATRASAWLSVDIADLAGTFTPTEIDPAAFDEVLALFDLAFDAETWTGTVAGQANGAGPSGTAASRSFSIGRF